MNSYGWRPDTFDYRDRPYSVPKPTAYPPVIDLRSKMPPIYDQGQLGSCTANSIAAAVEYERMAQGLPAVNPSRLFIYYNERVMEGTVNDDAGAQIRDGIKSVASLGVCVETEWPYDISQFAVKPPDSCYADALKDHVLQYSRLVQNLSAMQTCLYNEFPFCFGFTVYDSFETDQVAQTGIVPMPDTSKESVQGGHAVLCVGYDDTKQMFIVRNSWSDSWGLKGYMLMPFAYLLRGDLSSDFWNIELVSRS